MSAVYYCWLCDKPLGANALSDKHYETGRVIRFCSTEHWVVYQDIKGL